MQFSNIILIIANGFLSFCRISISKNYFYTLLLLRNGCGITNRWCIYSTREIVEQENKILE